MANPKKQEGTMEPSPAHALKVEAVGEPRAARGQDTQQTGQDGHSIKHEETEDSKPPPRLREERRHNQEGDNPHEDPDYKFQEEQEEENDGDPDVEIERENSAWDALGERFQEAASRGRYIDLTEQAENKSRRDGPRVVSAENARREFARLEAPVDPSTVVAPATAVSTESAGRTNVREAENPVLQPLWDLIAETIFKLQSAREILAPLAHNQHDQRIQNVHGFLEGVNLNMAYIQEFVEWHSDPVANSTAACRRIQDLNLLVHKANIFINQINSTHIGNAPRQRQQVVRRRNPSRASHVKVEPARQGRISNARRVKEERKDAKREFQRNEKVKKTKR
mmetsp:Transcript_40254/g.83844  ORF Transcript_40254/g.83844 Transcript_40254/m.83844 type:complete len:338 (-) Transcript_40254:89-1102(-)